MYEKLEDALSEMDFIGARTIANQGALNDDSERGEKTMATVIGKSKELNQALASNNKDAQDFLTSMLTKRFSTYPNLQVELYNLGGAEKNYAIASHIVKISHENLQQPFPDRWEKLYKTLQRTNGYSEEESAKIRSFKESDEPPPKPSSCTIS